MFSGAYIKKTISGYEIIEVDAYRPDRGGDGLYKRGSSPQSNTPSSFTDIKRANEALEEYCITASRTMMPTPDEQFLTASYNAGYDDKINSDNIEQYIDTYHRWCVIFAMGYLPISNSIITSISNLNDTDVSYWNLEFLKLIETNVKCDICEYYLDELVNKAFVKAKSHGFIGEVGKQSTIEDVTVLKSNAVQSKTSRWQGVVTEMMTAKGEHIKTFQDVSKLLRHGSTYTIVANVTKHNVWKYKRETIVSKISIVKSPAGEVI